MRLVDSHEKCCMPDIVELVTQAIKGCQWILWQTFACHVSYVHVGFSALRARHPKFDYFQRSMITRRASY